MARHWFGGDITSLILRTTASGFVAAAGGATVTFWSDQKSGVEGGAGGTQYTDLLNRSGVAITSVTARNDASLPRFQGPDSISQMWADAGGDERVLIITTDAASGTSSASPLADQGAWVTSHAYAVNDVVTQAGKRYVAALAHTSGTFATDLAAAKWVAVDAIVPASGTLASRPSATGSLSLYTATDVSGGTTYLDTGSGVWTQVGGPVTPASLGAPGYNMTPQNFKKLRKATAGVRNGTAYAKVLIAGDSTAWGQGASGSNPPFTNSWPKRLQELLQSYYIPATVGLNTYGAGIAPNDSRWTLGSGWSVSGAAGFGQKCITSASGAAGTLTFAPGYSCDTADIYYVQNSIGTVAVAVDGGASTNLTTAGAAAVKKTTISFAAGSAHSIVFNGATGGPWFLIGIDCYDSTAKSVRMSLTGVSGSNAVAINPSWSDTTGGYGSLASITAYAPDLTIVMLGINDAVNGATSATWQTATTSIITTAQASGDVLLATVIPSSTSVSAGAVAALEVQYTAAAQTLAAANNCGLIDISARFVDWATANTAGYMTDTLHATATGYVDVAQAMFNVLKTI